MKKIFIVKQLVACFLFCVFIFGILSVNAQEKRPDPTMSIYGLYNTPEVPSVTFPNGETVIMTEGYVFLMIDGTFTVQDHALIRGDTAYAPLRAIGNNVGAKVDWNAANQQATLQKNGTTVVLTIGSTSAVINGKKQTISAKPFITNGKTYVPLRFVSDVFGSKVGFYKKNDELFADYPVVWIENPSDERGVAKTKEEAYNAMERLAQENLQELFYRGETHGVDHEEEARELEKIVVVGEISRYWIMECHGHKVLVDKYTNAMYFCKPGSSVYFVEPFDKDFFWKINAS